MASVRETELTPADVAQALRRFGPEEWQELQLEIQASLLVEDVDLGALAELFAMPLYARPIEPRQEAGEPLPLEPPPTPEGDRLALEAVGRMAGSIPITDPEIGCWVAESLELSLYGD